MPEVPEQGTAGCLAVCLLLQRGQWHVYADWRLILRWMLFFQLQQLRRLAADDRLTPGCQRDRVPVFCAGMTSTPHGLLLASNADISMPTRITPLCPWRLDR